MDVMPDACADLPSVRPSLRPSASFGFIGLGMMGRPMATRILERGGDLVVFDRSAAALSALFAAAPHGHRPRVAPDPAALAAGCDVIALMLPDSVAVGAVLRGGPGAPGLLDALRPGTLLVDMGSSLPAETRALAHEAAARGAGLIDAPVSGSVPGAADGTLAIMVGGGDAAFTQARPLLEMLGRTLIRTGPAGSAHAMKALNNAVYAAGLLAAVEALHMAGRLGLDAAILTEVMNVSSGRNVATETKLAQHILSGRFAGGFQLGLMRKDLETAGAIAAETHFDAASLNTCRAVWAQAVAALGPAADNTEIFRYLGGPAGPAEGSFQ